MILKKPLIIGVSGYAGSGKDSFFTLLNKKLKCERVALADSLKTELRSFIWECYGKDILRCSREDKDFLRPLLLCHGTLMREKTSGRHWIESVEKKIKISKSDIFCVTDIRFSEYGKDEVSWLKEEMGGVLVHVSKYSIGDNGKKVYLAPPNLAEETNDPSLKKSSDFRIEWPATPASEMEAVNGSLVDGFINFLKEKNRI